MNMELENNLVKIHGFHEFSVMEKLVQAQLLSKK